MRPGYEHLEQQLLRVLVRDVAHHERGACVRTGAHLVAAMRRVSLVRLVLLALLACLMLLARLVRLLSVVGRVSLVRRVTRVRTVSAVSTVSQAYVGVSMCHSKPPVRMYSPIPLVVRKPSLSGWNVHRYT